MAAMQLDRKVDALQVPVFGQEQKSYSPVNLAPAKPAELPMAQQAVQESLVERQIQQTGELMLHPGSGDEFANNMVKYGLTTGIRAVNYLKNLPSNLVTYAGGLLGADIGRYEDGSTYGAEQLLSGADTPNSVANDAMDVSADVKTFNKGRGGRMFGNKGKGLVKKNILSGLEDNMSLKQASGEMM
jgi:hypothetical protein